MTDVRPVRGALALAGLLLLTACATPGEAGDRAVLRDAGSLGLSAAAETPAAWTPPAQWWRALGDAQFDALMDEVLAGNPALKQAQARMARAQAVADVNASRNRPQVDASAQASRERLSANGLYPPPLAGSIEDMGSLGLGASWSLDVFGRNRAALDAALGQARAAQADAEAARLLLATQTARQYVGWLRIKAQIEVAERSLAQRTETLQLVRSRVRAGIDSTLELTQAEAALPDAQLQIEQLREQELLARQALAALAGQPLKADRFTQGAMSAVRMSEVPAVLPADLLGRRPDIVAARWRVEAAVKETDVARAQFYPDVNLVAQVGLSAIGLDRVFLADSRQWSVGPAVRLPLFDGGRLKANLRTRDAELDAAIESYNAAVIEAVHEAVDQIASVQAAQRQRVAQAQAQQAAEKAFRIALLRYQAGLSNYLQVLTAETAVLQQRRLAVDLQAHLLDAQVGLVRALGGAQPPATETLATAGQLATPANVDR